MAIMKNEIPILEFDTNPDSVLMPNHEELEIELPKKAVFAFLGDEIDRYAASHGAKIVSHFVSTTKDYPVYIVKEGNEEIALVQAPCGASAAVQILDWLISYGSHEIISAGSCGVLSPMEENVFLVPNKALRDEGTSYHYLPPSRFVEISKDARKAIEKALQNRNLSYTEVATWSTDGFFRETKEKVEYRKSEGCSVVEMECSALAACAQMRGAVWGEILFTADTLSDTECYDERDWGKKSVSLALELCMESVLNL